jgi:hypothetical protein
MSVVLGQLLIGASNAYDFFGIIFKGNETIIRVFTGIISFFIFSACLFSTNALNIAAINSSHAAVKENIFVFSKDMLKLTKNKDKLAGSIYVGITSFLIFIMIGIPSIILNTDTIVDGCTNTSTQILFVLYGLVILGSLINRFKNKIQVDKFKYQFLFGIIAIIGCFGSAIYSTFFTYLISPILKPDETIG